MADEKKDPFDPFRESLKGLSPKQLKKLLAEKKAQLIEVNGHDDVFWEDYAQSLIDKMFSIWRGGDAWIKKVQHDGQTECVVFSPIGRPRHLWAYLHDNRNVRNAMDRRGPNSIIQGNSSDIGYMASYCVARECFKTLTRHGIDIRMKLLNIVHDSNSNSIQYEAGAIGLYFVEHGMTTLVSRAYKEIFGVETPIHHLYDMEVGEHGAAMTNWGDQRFDSLLKIFEEYGKAQKFSTKQIDNCLHNTEVIAKVRLKELKTDAFNMTLEGNTDFYREHMKGLGSDPYFIR